MIRQIKKNLSLSWREQWLFFETYILAGLVRLAILVIPFKYSSKILGKQAIDGLQGKLTIVIVAHRLSTIQNADQIFVFEQGKKVEHGRYQLLMDDKNSRFSSLASSHKK